MLEVLVALELQEFIPVECSGCKTAEAMCHVIARQVIKGELDSTEAGKVLTKELQENCRGMVTSPSGWATISPHCGYKEKVSEDVTAADLFEKKP